jgi:2-C-methyl-D-erythritol 2,4-cyclodiphosphate synthase
MRIGHGYDAHRFAENRRLVLGGVTIPYGMGLLGHSDADVLLHAVMDALLGALALGDIGKMFPDSSEEFLDADSMVLLARVVQRLRAGGHTIVNIDSTVLAQAPRLAPHILDMRENIASVCGMNIADVSVKATTEEGMGFTGSLQGIAAHAVCLVE